MRKKFLFVGIGALLLSVALVADEKNPQPRPADAKAGSSSQGPATKSNTTSAPRRKTGPADEPDPLASRPASIRVDTNLALINVTLQSHIQSRSLWTSSVTVVTHTHHSTTLSSDRDLLQHSSARFIEFFTEF